MIPDRFWLTDAQLSKIARHLTTDTRAKARVDDRRVISGLSMCGSSAGAGIWAAGDALQPLCPLGCEGRMSQSPQ